MLIALALIIFVNAHDLLAHLAGIDYRFPLMGYDTQLALVEFSVPVVQVFGSLLLFLGILFLFIQVEYFIPLAFESLKTFILLAQFGLSVHLQMNFF